MVWLEPFEFASLQDQTFEETYIAKTGKSKDQYWFFKR